MMRLVEDKESSRTEIPQHVPQTTDVSLVGHERMRDDKARTGRPRIGSSAVQGRQMAPGLLTTNGRRELPAHTLRLVTL
jgi:hypothetical protein